MKKMLMTASVPSMIGQFNMENINILSEMGYEVHVACNFKDASYWPAERTGRFVGELRKCGVKYHQIEYSRSPGNVKQVLKSIRQLDELLKRERFEFIHCHTPMAGAVGRICSYRNGVKAVYTAHGFHFYEGAPLKNWLVYYPAEKLLSRWTDVLITITREDYRRAKRNFRAGKTVYVPGVGIDIEKFRNVNIDKEKKRRELGISSEDIMIISVGELNGNKNHIKAVKAISMLKNSRYHYFIAGEGELRKKLEDAGKQYGVNLHLLGYRNDIPELFKCADLFVLPSIREGLNVSLMEAVASGLPSIASDIRGNRELIDNKYLFKPDSVEDICKHIMEVIDMDSTAKESCINNLLKSSSRLSVKRISKKMREIYAE